MKKFLLTLTLLSTPLLANSLSDYYEGLLQSKLSFDGLVEVTSINDAYIGHVVNFDVTSYGDTRPNWCYIVDDKLVECGDNWFNN